MAYTEWRASIRDGQEDVLAAQQNIGALAADLWGLRTSLAGAKNYAETEAWGLGKSIQQRLIEAGMDGPPSGTSSRLIETLFGNPTEIAAAGSRIGSQLVETILSAFKGGGNVGQSLGALFGSELLTGVGKKAGDFLGKTIGKTLGSTLGALIPGLGGLLGAPWAACSASCSVRRRSNSPAVRRPSNSRR